MTRLKKYMFFEPKKEKCFNVKFYKQINIKHNFIKEFNDFVLLKKYTRLINLIYLKNYNTFFCTVIKDAYNNYIIVI